MKFVSNLGQWQGILVSLVESFAWSAGISPISNLTTSTVLRLADESLSKHIWRKTEHRNFLRKSDGNVTYILERMPLKDNNVVRESFLRKIAVL